MSDTVSGAAAPADADPFAAPHDPMSWDPLAELRAPGDPAIDVLMSGTVFLDIVFTGLPHPPKPGTEVWAAGMASCPGGIANLAVAASRLGLRTSLAAGFGDDVYADFCWRTLEDQERVDLSRSRRFAGWHSPVTVSMAVDRDRSMVTHGHELPISTAELVGDPPPARAVLTTIGERSADALLPDWVGPARERGAMVFADAGWDPTGAWDPALLASLSGCDAFLPNDVEARAYTRTDTPQEAVRALARHVPLAVVTCGADGAIALDASTGEEVAVPALPVDALDPTGAGDVFGAAFVVGTLAGWPLTHRLLFAGLAAALAVHEFGGSLAAPGWGDIRDWWFGVRARAAAGDPDAQCLRNRYGFLDDVVPTTHVCGVRRAAATIARQADLTRPA
ncbi:Sugar or nucleoside kinase, ribokinase family [Pseudonocardia thermophila]|uniref:Sugar or nucleoside kinase, ribokinase family n=2 Tax=Pseudonocardia thermophila TaxID=1848 RepID=A0A1M6TZ40_PSETH|nr:Sugar or nucleoside kinase, ribokinase family [Pseudonocardia thermophila]